MIERAAEPATGAVPGRGTAVVAPRTAAIVNLGCKVNRSEVEAAATLLRAGGVRLVDPAEPADLVLVNTCTVTAVADQKSRQVVRRARRASPGARLVVTGCSVQVDARALRAAAPDAELIDNDGKAALLAELAALVAPGPGGHRADRPLPTLSGVDAATLDGVADDRAIEERTRAFIKVQDGCSFHCTYCIIPRARGPERSIAPDAVLADIRRALAGGHREIVLTGINVGTYDGGWSERGFRGRHVRSALTLAGLVRRILAETGVERIRLSSIEPQHVDDELLETWTGPGAGRCLPHLHVPLQSGDDGVLRRMGRRYDTAEYARVVERARAAIPGLALHADVIVGFPTEDEAAFERTVGFLRALEPAGLHVFRWSPRPGTPAVRMAGRVPETGRRARAEALLRSAAEARAAHVRRRLGTSADVLVERRLTDGRWLGHGEDHLLVAVVADPSADLANAIVRTRLERVDPVVPDRAEGRAVAVSPGSPLRAILPVVAAATSATAAPTAPSLGGAT